MSDQVTNRYSGHEKSNSRHNSIETRKFYKTSKKERNNKKAVKEMLDTAYELSVLDDIDEDTFFEIVDLYEDLLKLDPKNERAYEMYGNFLMNHQEFETAGIILQKCIDKFPSNSFCHHNMTNFHLFKGDNKNLQNSIKKCLSIDANNIGCLFNKAMFLLQSKKYALAIEIFQNIEDGEHGTSITFTDGAISGNIALCYEGLEEFDKALEFHKIACSQNNKYSCQRLNEI